MNIIIVFLTVLFFSLIGFIIIKFFDLFPKNNLRVLGYSYGLGVGLTSLGLYIFSRLGIQWNLGVVILPWILFIAIVAYLKKRNLTSFKFSKIPKLKKIQILFLTLIIISSGYTLFEALIRPLAVYDGWAIWLLKSKVFYIYNGIDINFLNYIKSDYPLVISLLGTFIYMVLGRVDDTAVLISFFAFYAFLGVTFFDVIKERFGTTYGLFMTFLLVTIQVLVRQGGRYEVGQADLAMGYYIFICVTLFLDYIKNNSFKLLVLLNIFLGITSLIKFEGLAFSVLMEILILRHVIKKGRLNDLRALIFWLLPVIEWQIYKVAFLNSVNFFASIGFLISFSKVFDSITVVIRELVNIKSWNIIWVIYVYSLFLYKFYKDKEVLILNYFIIFQFSIYLMLYFFTVGYSPESSIQRTLVHIVPLVVLHMAIVISKVLPNYSSRFGCLLGLSLNKTS